MSLNWKAGLAAAIALGVAVVPAGAQRFSDSFTFLKAVKERDGAKAEELLAVPGTQVVNTKDTSTGEGPLHIVAKGRDRTWLAYLLGKGARPDLGDRNGNTPLIIASQLGWVEGGELLVLRGAKVDQPNRRGETPLMFAVQNRDTAMVRFLLSRGADPKRSDSVTGYSALDQARRDPRAASILRLLENPAASPSKDVAGPKL